MQKLKAFVGHSFDDEDEKVIRCFTDFFNSLKDTVGLEWDHAQKAELKELSKKIREKMEGKNLFIGIFTRKDYRVEPDKLSKALWGKRKCASDQDLVFGTSDWIIQESGYALAKNMIPLFLIEHGVKFNAGLQGHFEFVEFQRDKPEACFIKLNEIIGDFAKQMKPPVPEQTATIDTDIKKEKEKVEEPEEEKAPTESSYDSYLKQVADIRNAISRDRDLPKAKRLLQEFLQSEDDETKNYWWTKFYVWKIQAGYSDSLQELEEFSKDNQSDSPAYHLGTFYKEYERYTSAAQQFLIASQRSEEKKGKIDYIRMAAECFALDDKFDEAYDLLLNEFLDNDLDNTISHKLYQGLANVAKLKKDDNLFFALSEKALTFTPTDHETRFDLAFRYGEVDNDAAALYHYKLLCQNNPNNSNWNNIGVAYKNLSMLAKGVDAYKVASDQYNETLSMANLAYMYINAGFLSEASEILQKAKSQNDYHTNVDKAVSQIGSVKENEKETEEKQLEVSGPARNFLVEYAETYTRPFSGNVEGEWESKHSIIRLNVEGNKISGRGEHEFTYGRLQALALRTPAVIKKGKELVELTGTISNRAINYEITINRGANGSSTLLGGISTSEKKFRGLMFVSEDSQLIRAMEKEGDEKESVFYEMKRTSQEQ